MQIRYIDQIKKSISEADLIVVGLGEEWNISLDAQQKESYQQVLNDLKIHPEYQWLLPYFYYRWTDDSLKHAYHRLFGLLEGKNYFVVATTTNRYFTPLVKDARFVMPCGTDEVMCDESLTESADYSEFLQSVDRYLHGQISLEEISFVKDAAGEIVTFNNIYAPGYKEEGYLDKWNIYMKWLQGTMNRKVCLLELGCGLQFPSVIRFPFEKMAYFNQKAICYRVHKSLYQLTEEMAERSVSVPMHAVGLFEDK